VGRRAWWPPIEQLFAGHETGAGGLVLARIDGQAATLFVEDIRVRLLRASNCVSCAAQNVGTVAGLEERVVKLLAGGQLHVLRHEGRVVGQHVLAKAVWMRN